MLYLGDLCFDYCNINNKANDKAQYLRLTLKSANHYAI